MSKVNYSYSILYPDGREEALSPAQAAQKKVDAVLDPYLRSKFVKGREGAALASSKLAKQLRLCEPEEASDLGHWRWLPHGVVMFELLRQWVQRIAVEQVGAVQIESPIMYNWQYPDIRAQGESFHERHYSLKAGKKDLVLRFAGDFGLFRIMKQVQMKEEQLPVRVYEFSKSFRLEKSGEVSGLKRPRAFHMPDIHCFCANNDQSWQEFRRIFEAYEQLNRSLGMVLAVEFPVVESFYNEHKDEIKQLVAWLGRPVLLEKLSEMHHYWVIKGDFHYVDPAYNEAQISTIQMDIKDAERYGINYRAQGSLEKKGCLIIHSSFGSIERILFGVLEQSIQEKSLPLWLAPYQIRILPVSEPFVSEAVQVAQQLRNQGWRVEVDDRNESLSKKIRVWQNDWVNYAIVYGQKEQEGGLLSLRKRNQKQLESRSLDELLQLWQQDCAGYPRQEAPGRLLMSQNPQF